jgi:hypothetical protein
MADGETLTLLQKTTRVLGVIVGLLLLFIILLGLAFGIGYLFNSDSSSDVPQGDDKPVTPNAKTANPPPYSAAPWPDSPGRAPVPRRTPGIQASNPKNQPPPPEPVGVTPEQYQEAVASGKKLFMPNPSGECDLAGRPGGAASNNLSCCFAEQVGR